MRVINMSAEFAPDRADLTGLTVAGILEVAASPQELADSMSEAEIRDRITVLDEDIETDLDIIEKTRQRVALSRIKLAMAQEALRLARDKGLE